MFHWNTCINRRKFSLLSFTWLYQSCWTVPFRNASLFICTSFTVAVFPGCFHHICNIKCRLDCMYSTQNIFNAKNFNPHKKPISLLNVPICTQGMQRTWWPEASTMIVTGPYWHRTSFWHIKVVTSSDWNTTSRWLSLWDVILNTIFKCHWNFTVATATTTIATKVHAQILSSSNSQYCHCLDIDAKDKQPYGYGPQQRHWTLDCGCELSDLNLTSPL